MQPHSCFSDRQGQEPKGCSGPESKVSKARPPSSFPSARPCQVPGKENNSIHQYNIVASLTRTLSGAPVDADHGKKLYSLLCGSSQPVLGREDSMGHMCGVPQLLGYSCSWKQSSQRSQPQSSKPSKAVFTDIHFCIWGKNNWCFQGFFPTSTGTK